MWYVVLEIRTRYEYVLQLFHQSLMNLLNGVIIKPNGTDQSFKVYGFLYSVSCDIPARSVLVNLNQYNCESCCPKCLQTGKNLRTPTGGNIRIFPYQEADSAGPKRNAHGMIEDAHKCSPSKIGHINGIKGPFILMFCSKYDPVQNVYRYNVPSVLGYCAYADEVAV